MKEVDVEEEILNATNYMKSSSNLGNKSSLNLYDAISGLIQDVLTERPNNSADLIESYLAKEENAVNFKRAEENIAQLNVAKSQISLFERSNVDNDGAAEAEEDFDIPLPDCSRLAFIFEQAGIGIGREEMYKILLSLKQLIFNYPLSSVRFWGKIFGLEADYIIAEVEYREGEGDEDEDESEAGKKYYKEKNKQLKQLINKSQARKHPVTKHPVTKHPRCNKCGLRKPLTTSDNEEDIKNPPGNDDGEDNDGNPSEVDDIPKSNWKPPPEIPKEDHHTGVNKKVYFACNRPGETWIKLPHVTPKEIRLARDITKFLTGRLDAQIQSVPPFPYKEANYLRAQIARISSSTHISPAGYFTFDDEEEDDEEVRENYTKNSEFEGLSVRELSEPSMCHWVHHTQYILPQGRCSWFNPFEKPEDDFEEEEFDEDETEEENSTSISESGPPLLSSVKDDTGIGSTPAWSTFASSRVLPEYAVAVAASNRWPGAYAFAKGTMFENIYIGWGRKYSNLCYAPPPLPLILDEFAENDELKEVDDPTVEEESELAARQDDAGKAEDDTANLDDDGDDDDDDDDD